MDSLAPFSPPVRDWFARTFDAPTPTQERGWPLITSGASTLIQAPIARRGFTPGLRERPVDDERVRLVSLEELEQGSSDE